MDRRHRMPHEPTITRAAELLRQLHADGPAADLSEATLAERIRQLEDWLAAVRNRSATLWSCADPNGPPGRVIAFRFPHTGEPPRISWDHDDDFRDPRDTDWKPLAKAPLAIRRAAFDTFSTLLTNLPSTL